MMCCESPGYRRQQIPPIHIPENKRKSVADAQLGTGAAEKSQITAVLDRR
jgi:Holliday junction resolvasome RuvABC endonuclease subunit